MRAELKQIDSSLLVELLVTAEETTEVRVGHILLLKAVHSDDANHSVSPDGSEWEKVPKEEKKVQETKPVRAMVVAKFGASLRLKLESVVTEDQVLISESRFIEITFPPRDKNLCIHAPSGQVISLFISENQTVKDVLHELATVVGIPVKYLKLRFKNSGASFCDGTRIVFMDSEVVELLAEDVRKKERRFSFVSGFLFGAVVVAYTLLFVAVFFF